MFHNMLYRTQYSFAEKPVKTVGQNDVRIRKTYPQYQCLCKCVCEIIPSFSKLQKSLTVYLHVYIHLGLVLGIWNILFSETQLNALLTLNLFCNSTSTCFGYMLPIIRMYTLYMYRNRYVLYVWLTGQLPINQTYSTYHFLYIYSVYILMMGNTETCRG
jgi:hypothetical protein